MTTTETERAKTIAVLAVEALPGAHVDDLLVAGDYAGLRWTRGEKTGLSLLRFEGGLLAQSWSASTYKGAGSWPDAGAKKDVVTIALERAGADAGPTRAVMERYFAIRTDQSRAEELREMFNGPMISHGPVQMAGVTDIDQLAATVKGELDNVPYLSLRVDDAIYSGDWCFFRWTYPHGESAAWAGLGVYVVRDGMLGERWQAWLPQGVGWR